jgi:catechol 2,3-dioxygenase-like lactoylglutathione lyase family enzyme
MRAAPLFLKVDAVTVPVPDLDAGLRFYRDSLGHQLRWRHDATGQAGLGLLDLSRGRYVTDGTGQVTGVAQDPGVQGGP